MKELEIELSEEKTKITNLSYKTAKFLGVEIGKNSSKESKIVSKMIKGKLVKSRINNVRLYFYIPVTDLLKKLKDSGFIKEYVNKIGTKKLVPNAITK